MVKLTREECLAEFYPEGVPKHLLHKPAPAPTPKAATEEAQERWSGTNKPLGAMLQEAGRADAAATDRLRKERERRDAENERIAVEHRQQLRQAEIDAALQRSMAYRAELAQWRVAGCHRGPGDPDWRWMQDWERD